MPPPPPLWGTRPGQPADPPPGRRWAAWPLAGALLAAVLLLLGWSALTAAATTLAAHRPPRRQSGRLAPAVVWGPNRGLTRPPFAFRPGQWVDFAIPGVPTVGGFSIVSSPAQLAEQGTLELAVKASPHPPARWVHESGEVGSEVAIRIGGSFSPPGGAPRDLLLVAGGIGINPLLSMIRAYADRAAPAPAAVPRVALLYSAATQAELAFRPLLDELALTHRWLQCTYFVTREPPSSAEVHGRRLEPTDMRRAAAGLRRPLCCLCGPPPMVDAVEAWAEAAGVAQGDVMVEKWW